ncbi:MAG: hypothetical protein JNG83_03915 [Opitutaceae bacterium]|nr:hypothetical protein [Opitutaceae bacterium]
MPAFVISIRRAGRWPSLFLGLLLAAGARAEEYAAPAGPAPQYRHGDILVSAPTAAEPLRREVSAAAADDYLRKGALAWARERNCVSCHTTGTYLVTRPSLTAALGRPLDEIRDLYVAQLRKRQQTPRERYFGTQRTDAGQVVYIASGLAEWDRYVTRSPSPETGEALALMFDVQMEAGGWANPGCWPPLESDSFHLATQAALAVAAAPGWVQGADERQRAGIERLKNYLRTTPPPHDYGRTLLLRAAAALPDLLSPAERQALVERIAGLQRPDGGWSIRAFARPEEWGNGFRTEKLRGEPEFADPPSDGHQTGLVIVALREAGVPASDPRIQRGLEWLEKNQRESGRWWTRSLNTDKWHFITYSGTAYPLLALALCDRLPAGPAGAGGTGAVFK